MGSIEIKGDSDAILQISSKDFMLTFILAEVTSSKRKSPSRSFVLEIAL
jgi:hypothetical protein